MEIPCLPAIDDEKDSMIRLCFLSLLILLCELVSVTDIRGAEPAFSARAPEFRQSRQAADRTNFYPRTSQRIAAPQNAGGENRGQMNSGRAQHPQVPMQRPDRQKTSLTQASAANPITPLDRQKQGDSSKSDQTVTRRVPSIWGTFGALLLVIGIILVAAKLLKKHHPMATANLPREVIEVLGKRSLDPRQSIHFVKCGSRILILGSSPAGLETLSEVLDPVEVDLITGMCRERAESARSNNTFRNLFQSTQQKSPTRVDEPAADRFRRPIQKDAEPQTEQRNYSDYDSAVSRLQEKLLQPSRQSLSDNPESDHG